MENIFKIIDTSLKKLYNYTKNKEHENLSGIYKCQINKFDVDIFIIKMFSKLTDSFPIAQNIFLTNKEIRTGETNSFMYRSKSIRN